MDMALSFKPEKTGWRVRKDLFFPVIPQSEEDIQTRRDTLTQNIAALANENLSVSDPALDIGITNFYLAYHNYNDRSLLQDIAKLHIKSCPELAYEAQHCQPERREKKDILRIGFLSFLFREHTVGKLMRGIIEHFSRDLFEVIIFRFGGNKDPMSEAIDQAADKVVTLTRNLKKDRQIIGGEELDILFYPDIGIDPYTYFLSFARFAPVQAVSWGHPDTTGIPNIDYFISSALLELPEASSHYSERLIRLAHLPTYYFRPDIPENPLTRSDLGLPREGHLYVCPQTLFKFHPGFDATLGDLLRRDPDGYLILIDDARGGHWKRLLSDRFRFSLGDVIERIIFIPHMPGEKFLGLLTLADVVLDIPTFSGGNSSFEALAMGTPIITWPQDFMRGRVTAALYKQMGLHELIATDADSYLSLALRLVQDIDFKRRMQADIKANVDKLYKRPEPVQEMERFFIAAYDAFRSAKPDRDWARDMIFTAG